MTVTRDPALKSALKKSQQRARRRAFLLVLPLLAFVFISFVVPIAMMLHRSAHNSAFAENMPQLTAWFAANPEVRQPDETAYAALVADLQLAATARTAGVVGTRVNYEVSGSRSLFTSAGRKVGELEPPFAESLPALNRSWASPQLWSAMRNVSQSYTANFYLAALDLARDTDGNIISAPADRQVYVSLFVRTLVLSFTITCICLLLGFPVAHLLATLPLRKSNLLMILVLLPFWTSLLVRTTAWIAILQEQGVFNSMLVGLGILSDSGRLSLAYNQTGTIIAMTHILLPFMILPLYSVMRTINPSYVRAARSLGASSWVAFRRIYLPQTLPGIGAGSLLVFILAVGYYITPALVGGASGQLISNLIAFHMQNSLNWSLAAALAALLLAVIALLYWLYDRLVGIDKMKLA
ncbi:MAG: ABC transporter permease [Mesorhizobium sp.]